FAAHPPTRFRQDRKPPRPIHRCAAASQWSSALVQAASTVLYVWFPVALRVLDRFREVTVKSAEAESLAGELLCLSRPALPRCPRRHGFASPVRMRFASRPHLEWPYRLRALVRADAATHVLALAFCSRNRDCEFF